MIKMKNIILILVGFALVLMSCEKFLEPKSQSDYVPKDVVSLSEALLRQGYPTPGDQSQFLFSLNNLFDDDMDCTRENANNANNLARTEKYKAYYSWHPQMFQIAWDLGTYMTTWKATYERIMGANATLDYVGKVEGSEDEKNYLKGQAYTLRAFYYFNIVNLWGEPYNHNKSALGVPLMTSSAMTADYPKRNTVNEVYSQIMNDLSEAEKCFESLPSNLRFIKDGRINMPFVQLMIARVALFQEDWETAKEYSKKVMDGWDLELLDLNSFTPTTAQPYYSFTKFTNPEAVWLYGSAIDVTRYLTDYIYLNPNSTAVVRRIFNASESLLNSFDQNDLRKDYYIIKESSTVTNYMAFGKVPVNSSYAVVTTDFGRAIRVSEAYLMYAESCSRLNDPASAIETLERLRRNRYKTGTGYSVPVNSRNGTALLEFIKEERRRELCFEGMRWFDLRRYGMPAFSRNWKENGVITATFSLKEKDPAYTLPIPDDVINRNVNLKQNKLGEAQY